MHRPFAGGFATAATAAAAAAARAGAAANGGGGGGAAAAGGGPAFGPGAGAAAEGDPALVHVLVRKMRNKAAGRIGDAWLRYDRATGRYEDEGVGGGAGGGEL